MFNDKFKRTYALSDKGVQNVKKGTFWTVIVNITVMAGTGILYLLMKEYMAVITDNETLPEILPYILMVVIFIIVSLFTHLKQYDSTYGAVYEEVETMRIGLAEKLRRLPLSFFGKRDLSDLTETIMGDVNRMEHVWSHVLGYLYGGYISTAVVAVMLFLYDWRMALSCLWGVPVAFILLFGSRKLAGVNAEKTKKAALDVSESIQEALECIREIHSNNQEDNYLNDLNDKIDRHERTMVKGELFTGLFVNAASVIMRLGVATTILTGTKLILDGEISFMTLFMFMMIITRIYAPFDQSLALIAELFLSQVSADRLMNIYDTEIADGKDEFDPVGHDIVFKDVSFAYDDENVLNDVSFTAKEGEITALVGPSGGGKSTCAKLAARLWDIDKGSIEVGGIDIATIDEEVLLSDYSMVFQDVTLFDDTVMENIRLGRKGATDEEVIAAAKAANCDEFVEKLPEGYDTQIGENGARLSGGERQRISIARALLKDAPIVLLDEATASLDVENETKIQSALSRLLEGKTVLVIAHRMRTIEKADRIIVLDDGKVIEQGKPEELLRKKDSVFGHMRKMQMDSAEWNI